jgi:hypothetical protein
LQPNRGLLVGETILLALLVLVGLFVVYEIAARKGVFGWHTISWYSKHHRWLFYTILGLFLAGGVVGAVWWHWHIGGNIPQ